MLKKLLVIAMLTVLAFGHSLVSVTIVFGSERLAPNDVYDYFTDVPLGNAHNANIYTLYRMGIVSGYPDNRYGLSEGVQRQHAIVMLHRLLKAKLPLVRPYVPFVDISSSHPYFEAIEWSYQTGILDGSQGRFNPSQIITREQMAKILVNTFQFSASNTYIFKDVPTTSWAYPFINTLYDLGISQVANMQYSPKESVTRGQMASFLVRSIVNDYLYGTEFTFIRTVSNKKPSIPIPPAKPIDTKPIARPFTPQASWPKVNSGMGFTWYIQSDTKHLHLYGEKEGYLVASFIKGEGKSLHGVTIGASEEDMLSILSPYRLSILAYGSVNYAMNLTDKLGTTAGYYFKKDGQIITIFLDTLSKRNVVGILAVNQDMYNRLYYTNGTAELATSYETLMPYLINQSRAEHGLSKLEDAPQWRSIARSHSADMVKNKYFGHQSSLGLRGGDRMTQGGLTNYKWWGENLAYGQENVLFSHEALMNSEGHRVNILRDRFTHVFTGVSFTDTNIPYITINFYEQ